MIARAVAASKTNNNSSSNNNHANYNRQESTIQLEKEKALAQYDRDIFKSFWDGVHTATLVQKDKIKLRKNNFRKSLNDSMIEQIFVDHSKELIKHKMLFDNEGRIKMLWDLLMGCLILFSIIIIPFRIGFAVIPSSGEKTFDTIVDFLFALDIIFSFNTAYVDPLTEVVITDRRKIAGNYFKLWFWIDLMSTVPFDKFVSLILGGSDGGGSDLAALRLVKILRLTRMLKLLRVLKLSKVGTLIESFNINPAIIGVQKLLLQICFMAHLVACFWHYLGNTGDDPNWIHKFEFHDDPIVAQYVSSFYWTISTMLTIGYGDISGTNGNERLFCIFTMILGGVMFGAVIAQVTRLIESRNPQARAFKEKMDEVKAYLNEKVLPMKLKSSIKDAYGFYLTKKSSFGETGIFEDLPPNLLNRLVVSIYSTEVHRIHLFKLCDENFIVKLIIAMKPFQALPGMKIIEKGDVADEIVFIMRGLVQFTTVGFYHNGEDRVGGGSIVDAVTGYSTEGGYFGDFEYFKRTIRMVTHRAMCNCNLMSLPIVILEEALQSYPLTNDKLMTEFEERYQNFLTASRSIAHKRDGFRVYIKETLVVDGKLQNIVAEGDTSEIYSKRVNSSNAVLEVHRTVTLETTVGKVNEIHAEEHSEDLLQRYILLPNSDHKIKWDLFIGILILYSVIVIPVGIGFNVETQHGLQHFDTVVDLFFGIDMILSLRTCYYDDKMDAFVVTPRYIYKHYLKTWFFIDLFSVLPFELLLAGTSSASTFRSLKLIKVVRLMRLLKLTRLAKLRQYLSRLEDSLGINPATFELCKMLLEVAFIGHLVCCFYWSLSWNLSDYAWFDKLNLRHAPLQSRYIATLYWTFTTLSTVGYGDITPVDTQGRIVTICVMVLGGTVFGYIVANVSNLMGSLDVTASRMNERIAEVSEYLIEKNASLPLAESIIKHVKYMFTQNSAFDERTILSRLPFHLCRKMILIQHSETLSKITLFQHIENKGIILYLFRLLTPIFYDSLHYLCLEGTLATEIVFIVSGKANVYKTKLKYNRLRQQQQQHSQHSQPQSHRPSGIQSGGGVGGGVGGHGHQIRNLTTTTTTPPIEQCDLISQLGPGDFFGHMSMMLKKPYQASVRTFMPSSVYTLTQHEISKLLRNFPAVAITLQGALALAISQSQSNNKQYLRVKRAEFLNSLGGHYVAAKAQQALREKEKKEKQVRELEQIKHANSANLSNYRRINSTESDLGAGMSGSTSQKIQKSRRSSIAMIFNRTKSAPIGNSISLLNEFEFSKISNEDDGISSQPSNTRNPASFDHVEQDSPDERLQQHSQHKYHDNQEDRDRDRDRDRERGRERDRDRDSDKLSQLDNGDSKEDLPKDHDPHNHNEDRDSDKDRDGDGDGEICLVTPLSPDSSKNSHDNTLGLSSTSGNNGQSLGGGSGLGSIKSNKYLSELPALQSKAILPPLSPLKFPKKPHAVAPVEENDDSSDSDEEGNALAIHDSSLQSTPQLSLKPLPAVNTHWNKINEVTSLFQSKIHQSKPEKGEGHEGNHQEKAADDTVDVAPSSPEPKRNPNSKWNLIRAVVHDPAAMAIIQQQLESNPIDTSQSEDYNVYTQKTTKKSPRPENLFNSLTNKGLGLIGKAPLPQPTPQPPPANKQIVRRSSSIAAVVRASIANRKRQRVMLLLAGNELYDSDEDKKLKNPFYILKIRAQVKRNHSCPNFSSIIYQIQNKKKHLNELKRRISFPSLDYDVNHEYVENQFYL